MISEYFSFFKYIINKLSINKSVCILILISIVFHAFAAVLLPLIIQIIMDHTISNFGDYRSNLMILLLIFIPIVVGTLMIFQDYQSNKLGHIVSNRIRTKIFSKFTNQLLNDFNRISTGDKLQQIIDEPEEFAHWIYITATQIIINFLATIFMLFFMFYYDIGFGIISLILLSIYIIPFIKYRVKIEEKSNVYFQNRLESTSILNENINSLNTFKSMGVYKILLEKYKRVNKKNLDSFLSSVSLDKKNEMINSLIMSLGIGLVFFYGGYKVINSDMTIGVLIGASLFIERIFLRGQVLLFRVSETVKVIPVYKKILESEKPESNIFGLKKLEAIHALTISNKLFNSKNYDIQLKEDFINIPLQKFNIIMGESGVGKSTLLFNLARYNIPNTDSIYINKENYLNFSEESYKDCVGFVPQNIELINIKVSEYLHLDGEVNNEYLDDIIKNVKAETLLDKSLYSLSGGQKKLIGLIKALIRNPQILIIDELTAGLDKEKKLLVIEMLSNYVNQGNTVIFVTHDVELIDFSDHIHILTKKGLVLTETKKKR